MSQLLTEIPKILRRTQLVWTLLFPGAVFLWLSTLFLLNELNLDFLVLIRGVGLAKYSANMVIISHEIDYAIWLLSLVAILLTFFIQTSITRMMEGRWTKITASLLITSVVTYLLGFLTLARIVVILASIIVIYVSIIRAAEINKLSKRRALETLLVLVMALPLAIEFLTSIRWILNGFDSIQPFSDPSWNIAFLELQMTNILQPILPRLFVLFSLAWLLGLLTFPYEKIAKSYIKKILYTESLAKPNNVVRRTCKNLIPQMMLGASIIAVIFIGVYPYLPAPNPSSQLVGVDIEFYRGRMEDFTKLNILDFLTNITRQDRSLYIALQQTIATLTGSTDLTIRIIPTILGLLLTISGYYFVSTSARDKYLAALAAIFTTTSYQILAGINAGFYANWLALAELMVFLTFFLKAVESRKKLSKYSIISTITGIAILFTHSATWIVLMACLATYFTIVFLRRTLKHHEAVITSQIIIVNIAVEILKNSLLQSHSTTGVAQNMMPSISYTNLLSVFQTLEITFTSFLGGAYANPLILIISTIGLFQIAKSRQRFHQILLAITIVCTLGTFFTSSTMPYLFQSRFIYLIPFHILAAIGLKKVINTAITIFNDRTGAIAKVIPLILQITVFTYLLSYALRVVGFIYTV